MSRHGVVEFGDYDPDVVRRSMVSDEEARGLYLAVGSYDAAALGRAFAQGRMSHIYRDHERHVQELADERDDARSGRSVWRFLCLVSAAVYFVLLALLL